MDSNGQTPSAAAPFRKGRALIAALAAVLIVLIASWIVRTNPNPGYQAGYEAATDRGGQWIRAEVDEAGFNARAVCEELHQLADQSPGEPRYERDSFIRGCSEAVDRLYGRHVPLASGG